MQKNLALNVAVLLAAGSLTACGSVASAGVTVTKSNNAVEVTTTSSTEAPMTVPTVAPVTVPTDEAETVLATGFAFTPPEADYSVLFPAEPTAKAEVAPMRDGSSLPFTFYVAGVDNAAYGTSAIVYPQGTIISLEGARDGALAKISATLTWTEPITLQGRNGLQFTGTLGESEGTVLSQVYAGDARLYQLIVVMAGVVALDDPRVVSFFSSFRFTVDE